MTSLGVRPRNSGVQLPRSQMRGIIIYRGAQVMLFAQERHGQLSAWAQGGGGGGGGGA